MRLLLAKMPVCYRRSGMLGVSQYWADNGVMYGDTHDVHAKMLSLGLCLLLLLLLLLTVSSRIHPSPSIYVEFFDGVMTEDDQIYILLVSSSSSGNVAFRRHVHDSLMTQ